VLKRLLLIFFLLAIAVGAFLFYAIGVPYAGFNKEAFVDIPTGTSTRQMASMLRSAGVIREEWQFLVARAVNANATLQAGEYRFDRPMNVWDVFRKIARGDIFYYELRVPEGSNIFDIAAHVQELGLMKSEQFLKAARDPTMIRDLAPMAPTLEGYLFPSTYRVTRRTSAQQITREMTGQFRRVWQQLGGNTQDVNRAVTLASLVEKETAVPEERRTVASVYHNRLRQGMKLDCDPTVIYSALLDGRWRGTIYRSDLDNPHPYNTYRNPGLPPGPIANPGLESLRAAVNPAQTNYLFFVAKPGGSGAHVFTESLGAHNAAVRDYRSGASQ
jgi:UPF0755 protein